MARSFIKGSKRERIFLVPDPLEVLDIEQKGLATIKWKYVGSEFLSQLKEGICPERFFSSLSPEEDKEVLFFHLASLSILDSEKRLKGKVFLNVKPQTFLRYHKAIDKEVEKLGINKKQVVFEVREEFLSREELKNLSLIKGDYAFAFAIDDFGTASSNVDRVRELEPEYIKLDMSVFHTASEVVHVVSLLRELHPASYIIAEKVETQQDLERAVIARITLWQGYLEKHILQELRMHPRHCR